MKKLMTILMGLSLIVLSSCTRVDAGYEGIKVNLAGSQRGVDSTNLVTGWVWYNPFTTKVYKYAAFALTIDYEPFTVNAKGGAEFTVDPTVTMSVAPGYTPFIFGKYRATLEEIMHGPLYNQTKDAFRIQLNKFTVDELINNRDSLDRQIEQTLREILQREGFVLDQLTSGLKYPEELVASINKKNIAIQDAMTAQNKIVEAEAIAQAMVKKAEGEAEANRKRQTALTPQILEQMWIEKWDGKLPVYGEVPVLFRDITK
ncbi:MAG: hypothetical protein LBE56_12365 [Tannerella sp.]|jgi:regulator of protease activity HflC (stomatin/prohibitin superfamily)|nr:hypothetical protein [Tannerella sp.]